jgi:hypothetical protein
MKLPQYLDNGTEYNSARIASYEEDKQLFLGNAFEAFNISQWGYFKKYNPMNPQLSYNSYNWFGLMTKALADLIYLNPPVFEFKNEANTAWFKEWAEDIDFDRKGYEGVLSNSYLGDAVFKIIKQKDTVNIVQIDPSIWFPEFDPSNPSGRAKSHTLKYSKKIDEKEYYLFERHESKKITYSSFVVEGEEYKPISWQTAWKDELSSMLIDTAKSDETELVFNTNCSEPLIVHIPNFSLPDSYFGLSDYTVSIKSKVFAYNNNATRVEAVLAKFADPKLIAPNAMIEAAVMQLRGNKKNAQAIGLIDDSIYGQDIADSVNQTALAELILGKSIYGMPADGSQVEPKALVWNADLTSSFKQMEALKMDLMQEGEISPILLDPSLGAGATGIAVKRLMQITLNKAQRKIMYLKSGLKELVFTALELSEKKGEYPSITFQPNIIEDIAEIIANNQLKLDMGVQSKVGAIEEIYNLDQDQAETKYTTIQEETAQNIATFNPELLESQTDVVENA